MNHLEKTDLLLDLIHQPAFSVVNHIVNYANHGAKALSITEGTPIEDLLRKDIAAYEAFESGCLYLTIDAMDTKFGASVTRHQETTIFVLDDPTGGDQLRALETVGTALRMNLSNVMALIDANPGSIDNSIRPQLKHNLYQMLRTVINMCDAPTWGEKAASSEYVNVRDLFNELMENASAKLHNSNITLNYRSPDRPVNTLINPEMVTRALYNMLSNAYKYAQPNSTVEAELIQSGNKMRISIENSCTDVQQDMLTTAFMKYMRSPGLDDPRQGAGLGMTLIRTTATSNGGTVLIDQPEPNKVRVTLTLAIRKPNTPIKLRSPMVWLSNYAGGLDLALIELSALLSADAYTQE